MAPYTRCLPKKTEDAKQTWEIPDEVARQQPAMAMVDQVVKDWYARINVAQTR